MKHSFIALFLGGASLGQAEPQAPSLEEVKKLAGCYLVDYSYSENRVIDPEYQLDPRVYDASQFTVKELIQVVAEDEHKVRLQHFMQADSFGGETVFMMRHHGEVWHKNPEQRYRYVGRFAGNDHWESEELDASQGKWVREILSLDDGPRYQCLGHWRKGHAFPRFDCAAFAPIPGRETRDMGRTDYNTMERQSSVLMYPDSWLERQNNIKVQFSPEKQRQLAGEVGKIWSVRLPISECTQVQAWAAERQPFWDLLAEVWQDIYAEHGHFYEIKNVDGSTRSQKISRLLQQYYKTVTTNPEHAEAVRQQTKAIIEAHRE